MILDIFRNWQVIIICIAIIILLPVIFYVSSFDNRPVKIKRVRKKLDIKIDEKEEKPEEEENEDDNEEEKE